MGLTVIARYKPKPGKEAALQELMATHLPTLKREGTIVEVFEWLNEEATRQAHTKPAVLKMWDQYAQVCDYLPVGELAESGKLFSAFNALN